MSLTVKQIEHAKPRAKKYKLYDERGLALLVTPNGGKWWRFKYTRPNGKANWISLGVFPDVSLAKAREARDDARKLLGEGKDPSHDRQEKKLAQAIAAANDIKSVAEEFISTKKYSADYMVTVVGRLENYVYPKIGSFPISAVTPPQVLAVVKPIEAAGLFDTAHRVLQLCGRVFRYGVQTGRCPSDPTRDLRGALTPCDPQNFAAITDPQRLGPFLRIIEGYWGTPAVCDALKLAPLVFTRPGELRQAKWVEIDLNAATWCFSVTKRLRGRPRRELIVPLSRQAVEILLRRKALSRDSEYVFPGRKSNKRSLSDNAINTALRTMGISKEEMCGHGFRATAETILLQELHVPKNIIELQLGHLLKDPNGTAYDRAAFLADRREMMQKWADYLDGLKTGVSQ